MVTSRTHGGDPHAEYHHGNLRTALLNAVEQQLPEKGPEGVSLRAAAKAVGVSSAAAFRHFRDKRAVMSAIAARAHNGMADRMEAASDEARKNNTSQFVAIGHAYLDFALSEPMRFQTMFRTKLLDTADEDLIKAEERLTSILLTHGGDVDPSRSYSTTDRENANQNGPFPSFALLAWGAVHGLANLAIEDAIPGTPTEDRKAVIHSALALIGRNV